MRRLLHAAVHNPVATNLLMLVLIIAGVGSVLSLNREALPHLSFDIIQIRVEWDDAHEVAVPVLATVATTILPRLTVANAD